MVYFMDNPTKMDDLGGTPILRNLHLFTVAIVFHDRPCGISNYGYFSCDKSNQVA